MRSFEIAKGGGGGESISALPLRARHATIQINRDSPYLFVGSKMRDKLKIGTVPIYLGAARVARARANCDAT